MKKIKALVLFSGGLDSRLALKIMQEQLGKKNITSINFILPFGAGCCNEHCALKFAQNEQVKLKIIDCTKGRLLQEYLEIVKKPKFGYGSCLNPCIDCRIFMLKKAREYADKEKVELIVTGEVLDERPMSQHKRAMEIVEEESGLRGRLLRPLSAKLLPETDAEKKGLIDRSKLLDIKGRGRKVQIELAKEFNISYPSPAGGCLLCEEEFVKKLKPLLGKKINEDYIQLLKIGRHFEQSNIILGRNKEENDKLEKFKGIKIIPREPGASALIKDKKYVEEAKKLIQKYSKHEIKSWKIEN